MDVSTSIEAVCAHKRQLKEISNLVSPAIMRRLAIAEDILAKLEPYCKNDMESQYSQLCNLVFTVMYVAELRYSTLEVYKTSARWMIGRTAYEGIPVKVNDIQEDIVASMWIDRMLDDVMVCANEIKAKEPLYSKVGFNMMRGVHDYNSRVHWEFYLDIFKNRKKPQCNEMNYEAVKLFIERLKGVAFKKFSITEDKYKFYKENNAREISVKSKGSQIQCDSDILKIIQSNNGTVYRFEKEDEEKRQRLLIDGVHTDLETLAEGVDKYGLTKRQEVSKMNDTLTLVKLYSIDKTIHERMVHNIQYDWDREFNWEIVAAYTTILMCQMYGATGYISADDFEYMLQRTIYSYEKVPNVDTVTLISTYLANKCSEHPLTSEDMKGNGQECIGYFRMVLSRYLRVLGLRVQEYKDNKPIYESILKSVNPGHVALDDTDMQAIFQCKTYKDIERMGH